MSELKQAAERLAAALAKYDKRIVFAESCTAGLAAATLAAVPGISRWHCGSAVTYREQTKIDWLNVSVGTIIEFGVVSDPVARQMACGVLERTAEADVAVSVTGHLGPDAPAELDGLVYIAVAWRGADATLSAQVWEHRLQAPDRCQRQHEATAQLMDQVREWLVEQNRP